jgi:transposase-like protein
VGNRREYSDQTKAAVMAALLTGQSISSVATEYKLPKGTVSGWRKQIATEIRAEATQKASESPTLDQLLFAYVTENMKTLREQSVFFRSVDWLKGQDASELAVLHGVLADKTIRLLEVFGGNPDAAVLDGGKG